MKRPRKLSWRHLAGTAAVLAVGVGIATGWAVHADAMRSLAAAREACRANSAEFARAADTWMHAQAAAAAEGWIRVDERQSFQRAVELMLLGAASYIQVVVDDTLIASSADAEWASNVPVHISGMGTASGAQSDMVFAIEGQLLCDTVVPIGTARTSTSRAPANYARVGYDLSAVTGHVSTMRLAGAGIAFAAFLVLGACAGLAVAWLDHLGVLVTPFHHIVRSLSAPPAARGPLVLDEHRKRVALLGHHMFLPPKPFQLLSLLVQESGRVLREDEIVDTLWPEADLADSRDVRQCVYLLRKRLNASVEGAGACIANVKGFGYRFDAASLDELVREHKPQATSFAP